MIDGIVAGETISKIDVVMKRIVGPAVVARRRSQQGFASCPKQLAFLFKRTTQILLLLLFLSKSYQKPSSTQKPLKSGFVS